MVGSDVSHARAAAVLVSSGRPRLLSWLKERGFASLSERQAIANTVARALKAGSLTPEADVADLCDDVTTCLLRAAETGDEDALRSTLTATDCPTASQQLDSKGGATALMAAAEHGSEGAVQLLLQAAPAAVAGVDQARVRDGCTAAMLAVRAGHDGCLGHILAARANPDAVNHDGWSALMLACERGTSHAVQALLAAGASPTLGLHNGWAVVLTPLKLACIAGYADCVRLLLVGRAALDDNDGSRLDCVEADGSTMLLYAAQRTRNRMPASDDGNVRTVKLLLEAKAPPDQTRWDGITSLAYAAGYGDVDSARLLLAHGAEPSRRDEAGWTPLLWAAIRGHAPCLRLLLEHGVPSSEARPNGFTALMAAASAGFEDCIGILLGYGAAVDDKMSSGRQMTALMLAARHGHNECVRRLIEARASVDETDAFGSVAAVHAERFGDSRCLHLLRTATAIPADVQMGDDAAPCTDAQTRFGFIAGLSHLDSWHEHAGKRVSSVNPRYFMSSTHPHFANLLQLVLWEHGFARAEQPTDSWELMWHAGQVDPLILRHLKPQQYINKFPNSGCLTTKSQLWSTFVRMQRRHGEHHFGFLPTTFALPEEAADLRVAMTADGASKAEGADYGHVWIVKPVAACRGQGISLHRSIDGLPYDVAARRAVASRYVHPPYLVDGRKVDLRLYVLVTSWRPLVLYLHRSGLARLATEAYALDDLDDAHKHLTNYSINKHAKGDQAAGSFTSKSASNERATIPGPKITLDAFYSHLVADAGVEAAARAWQDIDDVVVKTAIAAEPQLGQAVETYLPRDGGRCFQLFGFDVMLDAHLKPWVIEVNLDPSLATDARIDLDVKGAVLTDLLNLLGVGLPHDSSSGWRANDEDVVGCVNAEARRAQLGGWRRLHPSALSASGAYASFFDSNRVRLNTLSFDVVEDD